MKDAASTREVSIFCPVCAAQTARVIYPEARDYITKEAFAVVGCSGCGASFTVPVPESLDRYYPRSYRRYNAVIITFLKLLYRQRVLRWHRLFSKPGKVLEIGCGDGFMLNNLQSLGWRVFGTERTVEMATFAREHFGITVFVEDTTPIPAGECYELVVMFQVLEHLADPIPQLTRASSLLAPGGKLIIGVPNFASWQSQFGRDGWFHLDVPRHLVHWTPQSIRAAADKADMCVDSIAFTSVEHDPYGWIQTVLNRVFHNGNRLTRLLMRADRWRLTDIGTLALAALMTPFACALSLISWIAGRGAIMQVVLSKKT